MVRNECFRVALDYLYKNKLVADQRELAAKIGVSETSISQIINNRVQKPSESTFRKLNDAFGNIFNPEYFRGHSVHLLAKDAESYAKQEENVVSKQYVPYEEKVNQASEHAMENAAMPKWADSIIQLVAHQAKTIESLRLEIATLHEEINNLIT